MKVESGFLIDIWIISNIFRFEAFARLFTYLLSDKSLARDVTPPNPLLSYLFGNRDTPQ